MADFNLGRIKFKWRGAWVTGYSYIKDDVVLHGGISYVVKENHTSSNVEADLSSDKLEKMAGGTEWKGNWVTATVYKPGDIVKYKSNVYIVLTGHTAGANFETSTSTNSNLYISGLQYDGEYNNASEYNIGNLVTYGNSLYLNIQHTTGSNKPGGAPSATTYAITVNVDTLGGTGGNRYFVDGTQAPDLAFTEGNTYIFNQDSGTNNGHPILFSRTGNGSHAGGAVYEEGVEYYLDGQLQLSRTTYLAGFDAATTRQVRITVPQSSPDTLYWYCHNHSDMTEQATDGDWSTITVSESSTYWALVASGAGWRGAYNSSESYFLQDIVTYGGYLYIAKNDSTGVAPTETNNWDIFATSYNERGTWDNTTVYSAGDVIKYGAKRYIVKQGQTPPVGTTPTTTQYYDVFVEAFEYKGIWQDSTAYYPGDIVLEGGRLWEAQVVHTSTLSNNPSDPASGGGIWSTFLPGMKWNGQYNPTTTYYTDDVVEYNLSSYIALRETIGDTPNVSASDWSLVAQGDASTITTTRGDIVVRGTVGNIPLAIGPAGSYLYSDGTDVKWGAQTPQQDYFVSPQGDDTNDGRTPATAWKTIRHACDTVFNRGQSIIAIASGSYTEQCPIRVGKGIVVEGGGLGAVDVQPNTTVDKGFGVGISDDGSTPNANSAVFQMNNGARLRNIVFRNFSTGSVQAQLDPGTGPNDTSVWITSQSPYVQNCTNFTPGGTGMKIDGALHNGGYKSMVANDWTQINSDGIGVHALNDGRSELVSVFTYYCDVGYLAESGGKIRSVNGSSAYGEFAVRADGFSQAETPLTGHIRLATQELNAIQEVQHDVTFNNSFKDSTGDIFAVGHTAPAYSGTNYATFQQASSYMYFARWTGNTLDWQQTLGAPTSDNVGFTGELNCVCEDTAGGYYAAGRIYQNSVYKGFIVKFTRLGEIQWQKVISATDNITGMVHDEGQALYIAGNHSTAGATLAKLSNGGVIQWSETINYDGSTTNSINVVSLAFGRASLSSTVTYVTEGAADLEGKVFLGFNDSTANETGIVAYDSNGNYIKSFHLGDYSMFDMKFDNTGEDGLYFAVGGQYVRSVTSYAYPQTQLTYSGSTPTTVANVNIGGGQGGSVRIAFDTGGATLDQNANITVGYSLFSSGTGVATVVANQGVTGNQHIIDVNITSGTFVNGENAEMRSPPTVNTYNNPILARIRLDGEVAWQKQYASLKTGRYKAITPLGDELYAVGSIETVAGSNVYNGLISSFDSTGIHAFSRELSDNDSGVELNSISIDGVNLIMAGMTNGNNAGYFNFTRTGAGFGTLDDSSGAYNYITVTPTIEDATILDYKFHDMDFSDATLALTDTNGVVDNSPEKVLSIQATRQGFASIGTGISFSVDGLTRPIKDGSVAFIDGDSETYFIISTSGYQQPTFTTGNDPNAYALLNANKAFLQEEVIQYIDATYPSLVYDTALCRRDTGLIIDAVLFDLDTASNGESVDAGYSYYSSPSARYAITTQKAETVAANTYLKTIIGNVINETVPTTVRGAVSQVTDAGLVREAGSDTRAQALVQVVIDIINIGKASAPAKINYGTSNIAVDPKVPSNKTPDEGARVTIREAFSQVRMTGHDFLDIGTGGFADTNYPVIIKADYGQTPNQEAETISQNGGRVFYVTTDQDGNFRVGDYFKVEQATGRATLSSEEFDLTGLNELQLGSITAGKTGATINEFSTDPNLTDISDNSVPTEGAVYKFVKSGFMGTDALVLARGATNQRPTETIEGMLRYNTTLKTIEFYNGTEWATSGGAGLSIVSITPNIFDPDVDTTIEILGDKFSDPTGVKFGTITVPLSSVTYVSEQEITVQTGAGVFSGLAAGRYNVELTTTNGSKSTLPRGIEIDNAPTANTPAGSLGSFSETTTVNITSCTATDADGDTITYTVILDAGSLFADQGGPLTMNSATGAITGTLPSVPSTTTKTFTVRFASQGTNGTTNTDVIYSLEILQNTAPTFTSPTAGTTPGGDDGTTSDSTYGTTSIQLTANEPDPGQTVTYSVQADPEGLFSNGLSLNAGTGLISGTINHSWLNRAYDRTGSVTIRVTDDAAFPASDDVTFNIKGRTTWRYRTVINRGYMAGGYKSSVPWSNVNRTSHSNDTSNNLGNIMSQPGTYMDGGHSDVTGWTWGNDPSYPTNSNRGWAFNMTNDSSKGYNNSSLNMSTGRNDHGVSNYDTQFSVITGGGSANTDIMNHSTETMRTNVNNSGLSSDYVGAAWSSTAGYHWNGTHRKISFSTESWSGMFGTQGTHSKGLTSKYGYYYIGPPNNSRNLEKVNSSNDSSQGTIGNFPNGQNTQGEHNMQMGQDAGYSIGMWQGSNGQANDSWKMTYSNDSMSNGSSGQSALQPKGQPGCSSGAMFSTGI